MIKDYEWRDPRNAVDWAATCARLALPFYDGDRRGNVVAAIEIAERYAAGEEIDDAAYAAYAAYAATAAAAAATATAASAAASAANAAASAASAHSASSRAAANAANAANAAARAAYRGAHAAYRAAVQAGVSQDAVDQLQLSAIAVDLGLVFESETYFAAIAALAIGDIAWAREIAESSECA